MNRDRSGRNYTTMSEKDSYDAGYREGMRHAIDAAIKSGVLNRDNLKDFCLAGEMLDHEAQKGFNDVSNKENL